MANRMHIVARSAGSGTGIRPPLSRGDFATALALFVLAFGLRLWGLGSDALWLDEGYSDWFSGQSWAFLWQEVPKFETHPPLYYSLLKLSRAAFGDSEFALRLPSALAGAAVAPLVFAAVRRVMPDRPGAARLAGLLAACSAVGLAASQDARPYAVMTLAMAIALLAALRILTGATRAAEAGALGAGLAGLCWLHNLGPLFALSLGAGLFAAWLLSGRPRAMFAVLLASAGIALLLYAPWITRLLAQAQNMEATGFWIPPPGAWDLWQAVADLPFGAGPLDPYYTIAGLQARTLIGWTLIGAGSFALRRQPRVLALLWCAAILPVVLSLILSFTLQPVFLFRTLQPAQLPLLLLIAAAPAAMSPRADQSLAAVMIAVAIGAVILFQNRPVRDEWREVAAVMAAEGPVKVVLVPNETQPVLDYYRRHGAPQLQLVPLPGPYPVVSASRTYPVGGRGVPRIDPGDADTLTERLSGADRIWLLSRGAKVFDPDGLIAGVIAQRFPCQANRIVQDEGTATFYTSDVNDHCR